MMAAGAITDTVVQFLSGGIGLIIVASIILGFILQSRAIKKQHCDTMDAAVSKAREEARKESASELAFRELKQSVEQLQVTMQAIAATMTTRTDRLEGDFREHIAKIAEVDASARSAHKRLDEHKAVDHNNCPSLHPHIKKEEK